MYVQHPYKFEGKYYAKIDGVFYEISKEVAMAMFADYRNEIYRSRKWAPDDREEDLQMEELQNLQKRRIRSGSERPRDVRSSIVPSVLTAMDFLLPIWQMTHSSALKN